MWQRYVIVAIFSGIWKIVYYTPRTHKELHLHAAKRQGESKPPMSRLDAWSWFTPQGRTFWLQSLLSYIGYRFVLLPLLFLPLGGFTVLSVLLNSMLAEIFTNMRS